MTVIKHLALSIMILFSGGAFSQNTDPYSLEAHCNFMNGKMVTGHFINNVLVKSPVTLVSTKSFVVQVLYNYEWYEATGDAAPAILSTIEMGLLLHRMVNMCVREKEGDRKILGMQFTSFFSS